MKKLLLILLCLPMIGFGQQTYVPDINFENYLESNGMGNGIINDDSVLTAAIDTVTSLIIPYGYPILNLIGIEDFTALSYLFCSDIGITNLDLSNNINLQSLNCNSNSSLTTLDVSNNTALTNLNCSGNQLTTLDVSNNTALINLNCSYNKLTSLDVTQNIALTQLSTNGLSFDSYDLNPIQSLDLSNNINLEYLYCVDNSLSTLDISSNVNLLSLNCKTNFLLNLDVSQNINLTSLIVGEGAFSMYGSTNNIQILDVSNNLQLEHLECGGNQLSNLDVSLNTSLTYLDCSYNQLNTLDVRNNNNDDFLSFNCMLNPNLLCINVDNVAWSTANWSDLYDSSNETANIDSHHNFSNNCSIDVGCTDPMASNYDNTVTIDDGSCIYSLTHIPDNNFEQALKELGYDFGPIGIYDGYVRTSSIDTITSLDLNSSNISDLTGIEDFTALTLLKCNWNTLTFANFNQNSNLSEIDLSHNDISILSISGASALTNLNCYSNNISYLDVSQNIMLKDLTLQDNQIASIDVTQNINLEHLRISGNGLISNLDVSNNTALISLSCAYNNISSIDVSNNPNLMIFNCANNPLIYLNVQNGNNINMVCESPFIPNDVILGCGLSGIQTLNCIQVDNEQWSYDNWFYGSSNPSIDTSSQYFSTNCSCNASITQLGGTLSAVTTPIGLNADWYNIQTDNGETRMWLMEEDVPTFNPTFDCSYFIVVNENGCIDTSETYSYGANAARIGSFVTSPNPTTGLINVKFENSKNQFVMFELISNNGSKLDEFITIENNLNIDLSKYPSGSYYLYFNSEDAVQGCRLEELQKVSTKIILNK